MLMNFLHRFSKKRSRAHLYEWLQEALVAHKLNERQPVLNVGAGGEVADIISRAGVTALSIDIDPGRRPDMVADIENLAEVGDASVGAVICVEVLEHVKHPHQAVAELWRILKPGGLVVGSTPFILGMHDRPADYFRFTRYGLQHLFSDFEQQTLRERNGYFAAAAVMLHRRFVVGSRRDRRLALLLSPLLLILVFLLEAFDRLMPADDATTGYFFVFRKPDSP